MLNKPTRAAVPQTRPATAQEHIAEMAHVREQNRRKNGRFGPWEAREAGWFNAPEEFSADPAWAQEEWDAVTGRRVGAIHPSADTEAVGGTCPDCGGEQVTEADGGTIHLDGDGYPTSCS